MKVHRGTSRRAREDNNLTGYGVTSDHAKGIIKSTKEAGLLATAETLHEKYLTPGGSYYVGTSAAAVNKHYCVGGEWACSSCKECLFINESFIIFYFCIDFIESQCYNLQEIKKKRKR